MIPRPLIDKLVAALRLPPGYTGSIVVRLNVHKGTVGKTTLAVEETIKLGDANLLELERMYDNSRTRRN